MKALQSKTLWRWIGIALLVALATSLTLLFTGISHVPIWIFGPLCLVWLALNEVDDLGDTLD